MTCPIILNFDRSAGEICHAKTIDFTQWQDAIRFGCTKKKFHQFNDVLQQSLPENHGTVLMGSGDYHHISLLLIENLAKQYSAENPIQVVIFDNHPDNMRYLFGIHCGSWVSYVASLPFVSHVHVLGITSHDIGLFHFWENRWSALFHKKLTYWSLEVNVAWAKKIGLGHAFRHFATPDDLIASFLSEQYHSAQPVYLSIDKDALSEDVIHTNWDQGKLQTYHILDTISSIKPRIIGSDITGELSIWQPSNWFKRLLSSLDKQPTISPDKLINWQREQHQLNLTLLKALAV
ncbi:MAG: arginase family protein [Gilliamella sp.]|uniref:arginase family protein n=1 Tax=Gilliamella sp. TaxID=1891236 RepID=UPI0025F8B794|nr:arginase family protein [Gilliamella sp.]MCO6545238.1 arginase family protein [Gilliamella sp.]MCO6547230.1 arginase family protein [Gilliamella sp.]